jgi:hypothetical protein
MCFVLAALRAQRGDASERSECRRCGGEIGVVARASDSSVQEPQAGVGAGWRYDRESRPQVQP